MEKTKRKPKARKDKTSVHHFSITGEFVTERARALWNEGSPKNAVRFLEESLFGMKREIAIDVILGSKKIAGDTRQDPNLWLEDDSVSSMSIQEVLSYLYNAYFDNAEYVDVVRNALPRIPSDEHINMNANIDYRIKDNLKLFLQIEFIYGLLDRPINDFYSLVDEVSRLYRKKITEQQRRALKNELLATYPHRIAMENYQRIEEIQERSIEALDEIARERLQKEVSDMNPERMSLIDSFLQKVKEEDSRPAPTKKDLLSDIKNKKIEAGWLSPTGEFYGCSWMGHLNLIADLEEAGVVPLSTAESFLEENGWIKLNARGLMTEGGFNFPYNSKKGITQAQQNAIFDYMTARNLKKVRYNSELVDSKRLFEIFDEGGR